MKSSGGLKLDGSNFRLYRPRGGALRLRHLGPDALQLGIGPPQEVSFSIILISCLMFMVCIDVPSFELHGKDPHNPYTLLWQLTNLDYFITINHIHACIITHGFNHVLFHLFI